MAKQRKLGAMYFTGVTRVSPGRSIFHGHYYANEDSDEPRSSVVQVANGQWGTFNDLGEIVHGVGYIYGPKRQVMAMMRDRVIARTTGGSWEFEEVDPSRTGFFMEMRRIGEHWYLVGMMGQVYVSTKSGWRAMDEGIYDPEAGGAERMLKSIHGSSESDLYVVGHNGYIAHWNGSNWDELESPTDRVLNRVLSLDAKRTYICGSDGALYVGNADSWRDIGGIRDGVHYWDLAHFKGKTYLASSEDKLFVISGSQREEVVPPVEGPLAFYRMAADDDELWTVGDECVLQFDGKTWTQHVCPENT